MMTAVYLQQHAPLGVALPPTAVLRWSPCLGALHTRLEQDAPYRGAGDGYAPLFCQKLGKMSVVNPVVTPSYQFLYPGPEIGGDSVARLPSPVPMGQSSSALPSIRCQQPPSMAFAHTHNPTGLPQTQFPLKDLVQNYQPCFLFLTQHQSFHGLTFSLNS